MKKNGIPGGSGYREALNADNQELGKNLFPVIFALRSEYQNTCEPEKFSQLS
jgi:hypothetical protein